MIPHSLLLKCKIMKISQSKLNLFTVLCAVQVDLTEPILSRFDILCVVRDMVDPVEVNFTISHANKKKSKASRCLLQVTRSWTSQGTCALSRYDVPVL